MIDGSTVLAIIPARGGSKGVIHKNLREVGGKPLLVWTIEQAKASKYIDRLILSSDDKAIIATARAHDCEVPFVRPAELATDTSPTIDCIHHAMASIDTSYDYVVLLQVTSPLRNTKDIDVCIELCHYKGAPACISFTEVDKSPYWMYKMTRNRRMVPLLDTKERPTRRQDSPQFYVKNGAVYVAKWDWLLTQDTFMTDDTLAYIMPNERSLDVDSSLDLIVLDAIMSNKNIK